MKSFSSFFEQLLKAHRSEEKRREALLHLSRDLLRLSKEAIFAYHRKEIKEGDHGVKEVEGKIRKVLRSTDRELALSEGTFHVAMEEMVEARFLAAMLMDRPWELPEELLPFTEEILGGLSDATGEYVRTALASATARGRASLPEIERMKMVTSAVVEGLMKFHLTGKLRSKQDEAKRNLRRLEEMAYELTLHAR